MSYDEYRPEDSGFDSSHGVGMWYAGSAGAAIRGGLVGYGVAAGIFTLNLAATEVATGTNIGFRCVYRP